VIGQPPSIPVGQYSPILFNLPSAGMKAVIDAGAGEPERSPAEIGGRQCFNRMEVRCIFHGCVHGKFQQRLFIGWHVEIAAEDHFIPAVHAQFNALLQQCQAFPPCQAAAVRQMQVHDPKRG
jgi:hypothetical protein